MINRSITLDSLQVIDAIDRNGSFAAAASELCKVPSALSYTVNKLESELGINIFERVGQRCQLTQVGRLVLDKGRQILLARDNLEKAIRQISEGWEQSLTIAIDSAVVQAPVLKTMKEFLQVNDSVSICLLEEVLGGTWDALSTGRADLIIGILNEDFQKQYAYRILSPLEFVFAVAPEHPVSKFPQPIDVKSIHAFHTIVVADTSRHLTPYTAGILESRNTIKVASMAAKIEAQKMGLGVGFLPRHRIQSELSNGELVEVQISSPRPPQPIVIAWHGESKGKALNWFVEKLTEVDLMEG